MTVRHIQGHQSIAHKTNGLEDREPIFFFFEPREMTSVSIEIQRIPTINVMFRLIRDYINSSYQLRVGGCRSPMERYAVPLVRADESTLRILRLHAKYYLPGVAFAVTNVYTYIVSGPHTIHVRL